MGFPDGAVVKKLPANSGDVRDIISIPGLGRSPRVKRVSVKVAQPCLTLCDTWNSPGQNTGVGSLLQGIFPTQGLNSGHPHCRFFTRWAIRESPGVRNDNQLHQYSCLENSMDRGAWKSIAHEVAKVWHKYS